MAQDSVTTVRLDSLTKSLLDRAAKDLHVAPSALVRKAVFRGAKAILLDEGISRYQRGDLSAGAAAESAGVSVPEFVEELHARRLPYLTDEDGMRTELEGLRSKRKAGGKRRH